jgi:hypothetical protein
MVSIREAVYYLLQAELTAAAFGFAMAAITFGTRTSWAAMAACTGAAAAIVLAIFRLGDYQDDVRTADEDTRRRVLLSFEAKSRFPGGPSGEAWEEVADEIRETWCDLIQELLDDHDSADPVTRAKASWRLVELEAGTGPSWEDLPAQARNEEIWRAKLEIEHEARELAREADAERECDRMTSLVSNSLADRYGGSVYEVSVRSPSRRYTVRVIAPDSISAKAQVEGPELEVVQVVRVG